MVDFLPFFLLLESNAAQQFLKAMLSNYLGIGDKCFIYYCNLSRKSQMSIIGVSIDIANGNAIHAKRGYIQHKNGKQRTC